jgi:uncharacterized RDD family membrane protein YckC
MSVPYKAGPSGPRASFLRRAAAWLIDALIVAAVGTAVAFAFHNEAATTWSVIGFGWLYGWLLEGSSRGQTVGKLALRIRVYDLERGGPIGYGRSFGRQLVKLLSGWISGLGYLWMLWDKERQCWHDKAAGDVVVPVDAYS